MIKIVAIWYPSSNWSGKHQTDIVDSPDKVKDFIGKYIYDMRANNMVINYNNQLFVIESVDDDKRLYNRRKVTYHPLQHLIGA